MKIRSTIAALAIILAPFIIGILLFMAGAGERKSVYEKAHFIADTRENEKGIVYKGVKIDWVFCPDYEYKPLFCPAERYLVFVFHYTNANDYNIFLTPSYVFASPPIRRYSANEEISMYIEDGVENKLKVEDQTPITFEISPNDIKHSIIVFEKPHSLNNFYVDVDIFRDKTLRFHYRKENENWINYSNELIEKYMGRG